MVIVCGEGYFVLMLGNTVWEQLVNSFTSAGTSGWSALISWRHHRELRWTQRYGLPVSPCINIMEILKTEVYFSLEQSLTHTHTHIQKSIVTSIHSLISLLSKHQQVHSCVRFKTFMFFLKFRDKQVNAASNRREELESSQSEWEQKDTCRT